MAALLLCTMALSGCPDMFGPVPQGPTGPRIPSEATERAAAIQCQADLAAAPAAVVVDGVTDTTGGMDKKDVIRLLTKVGLPYVEVALREDDGHAPQLVRREHLDSFPWPAAHGAGYYAQMSLGNEGEPDCYTAVQRGWLFVSEAPIRPGACLRVTYTRQPVSRYEISGQALPDDSDLWRWTLKDRATGAILLGFTDVFGALQRNYRDPHYRPESSAVAGPYRPCHWNGYEQVLSRLTATPSAQKALARVIVQEQSLPPPPPDVWREIERRSHAAPTLLLRVSLPDSQPADRWSNTLGWEQSWALARERGVWMYGQRLVLPGQNLIQNLPDTDPGWRWLAAFDGDLIAEQPKDGWQTNGLLLAGFDPALRPLWQARMMLSLPPQVAACTPQIRLIASPNQQDLSLMLTLRGPKESCGDAKGLPLTATAILRRDDLARVRQEGKIDP